MSHFRASLGMKRKISFTGKENRPITPLLLRGAENRQQNKSLRTAPGKNKNKGSIAGEEEELSERELMKRKLTVFRNTRTEFLSRGIEKVRIDCKVWDYLKRNGKISGKTAKQVGDVLGIEVGDEFYYRAELVLVGLHSSLVNGIDHMRYRGSKIAICVVATEGRYSDNLRDPEVLLYVGEGGGANNSRDQRLKGGNLALRNSMDVGNPVRVVRGLKMAYYQAVSHPRSVSTTYVYDGLYVVRGCERKTGPQGNLIYQFELRRLQGQPTVSWDKYIRR